MRLIRPISHRRSGPGRWRVRGVGLALALAAGLAFPAVAEAAKIGELTDSDWVEQAARFWSFQDTVVRYAVGGAILMGISCGLLGSFIVVRRLSLVGDTISHAVLPGVALGFLWNQTKDPVAIFIGATAAGLLGSVVVNLIRDTTHIKEDSALGMVLSGFFAAGICLMTMIQRLPTGQKSGLDKIFFGQAAALSEADLKMMGAVTAIAIILVVACYKELLVTSFDRGFARSAGVSVKFFHYLLIVLLAFAVVISLQASGAVLVSAMLIIPAASAYLLTDRMHHMVLLSVGFGVAAGVSGCFLSFLGNDLPTGPFMVVGASFLFGLAFLFGPRYGLVPRHWRQRSRTRRIQVENTLKAVYQVVEASGQPETEGVPLSALAARRNVTVAEVEREVDALLGRNLAVMGEAPPETLVQDRVLHLTPSGWLRACEIVRNHRLWELYLTHAAHYEADHVHDDAEKIEHVLGEATVRQLERRLDHPRTDPHGKLIPSEADLDPYRTAPPAPAGPTGYQQPS